MAQEQVTILEASLVPLRTDSRKDIKVMANSYTSMLLATKEKLQHAIAYSEKGAEELRSAMEKSLRLKLQHELKINKEEEKQEIPTIEEEELGEVEKVAEIMMSLEEQKTPVQDTSTRKTDEPQRISTKKKEPEKISRPKTPQPSSVVSQPQFQSHHRSNRQSNVIFIINLCVGPSS